jgi:hypothetical protein
MPAGLFYTPVAGYRGTDTFSIVVADCADVPDTTTIALTIDALPAAGIIAGPDSICIAHPVTLSDTAAGGIWASANARATVSGAVISGISPGADTIFYIVSNICGADTATYGAGIFNCSLDTKNIAESSAPHIAIYPNPSDGAFTINISSNTKEQTHIVITNLDGEKVQEMNALTNMPINVTLSGPAGVYFISISTTNNTCNAKILIFND